MCLVVCREITHSEHVWTFSLAQEQLNMQGNGLA